MTPSTRSILRASWPHLLALTLLAFALGGCATRRVEITEPDGSRRVYEWGSLVWKLEAEEASFARHADGSVLIEVKKARSDGTRALDVAEKALGLVKP